SHNKNRLNFSIYQEFVFMLSARAAVGSVKYFHREGGAKSYMNQLSIAKSAFAFIKLIVFTEPDVGLERSDVPCCPRQGIFHRLRPSRKPKENEQIVSIWASYAHKDGPLGA